MLKRILPVFVAFLMSALFAVPSWAVPTNVPLKTLPSINGTLAADSVNVAPGTAIDNVNGNSTMHPGGRGVYFIVENTHATNPGTFTVTSVADELGRTGDHSAYELAAGEVGMFGPYPSKGWVQSDGTIRYTGSAATMKVTPVNAN